MSLSSIASRLKSLINALGLTDSQFADKCEISRATLSLLLSGKNKKISDVLLSQIHNAFPEVSIIWLLFDEGNMMLDENVNDEEIIINPDLTNSYQNAEFTEGDQEIYENSNLKAVNQIDNLIQKSINKAFEAYFNSEKFPLTKNFENEKPRKVIRVTVYYDDSTFETFSPE